MTAPPPPPSLTGLVVTDVATGVTLGGCPAANRTYAFYDGLSADVSSPSLLRSLLPTPLHPLPASS